ncbi:MAG: tetratricopeptide repeat protein [Gammaproteobacteria bacterium]|nr:tetratricopeptide repeat protein [Gammaproteobacteria bacterium]
MNPDATDIGALISAGRLAEARMLAERACGLAPDDPGTWYLRAAVSAEMGDWDDVAGCCRQVVALAPDHTEAWFNLAVALANLHRHAEAVAAFEEVLKREPGSAPACLALASCLKKDGRPEAAIEVLGRALSVVPDDARLHAAHADALHQLGHNEAAAASYATALRLDPAQAPIQYGAGCVLQALGRQAEAQSCFEAAVRLDPRIAGAYGRLGSIYGDLGRREDALRCFERLLALEPTNLTGLINYGFALQVAGRQDEAATQYQRALQAHPDSELARYFVATLSAEAPPGQAPASYMKDLFDNYAGRFDQHLVETLEYRVPEAMGAALREAAGATAGSMRILDLGCGTGLSGAAVQDLACRLVGVDLSRRMLDVARDKGIYDELHEAEIGEFLAVSQESFDAVVATDVFVYIGDLEPIMARVAALLMPGGLFVFSEERHEGESGYVLRPSGRYAHSRAYVHAVAGAAGLVVERIEDRPIRVHMNQPIAGDLYVLRRP